MSHKRFSFVFRSGIFLYWFSAGLILVPQGLLVGGPQQAEAGLYTPEQAVRGKKL